MFLASNAFLANLVFAALAEGGLEVRGQVIRLVRTLPGGDRPKNAEKEFAGVSTLPRGSFEPWGILPKPMPPGCTVGDCLRAFQTGGLRRREGVRGRLDPAAGLLRALGDIPQTAAAGVHGPAACPSPT